MAQRLVTFVFLPCCAAKSADDVSRPDNLKANFKKPGKNGMNVFRGVMITGPPGIGKTTSAHLCAKLAGFTPIELNASDARSKKLVEVRHLVSSSVHSQAKLWHRIAQTSITHPWTAGWAEARSVTPRACTETMYQY